MNISNEGSQLRPRQLGAEAGEKVAVAFGTKCALYTIRVPSFHFAKLCETFGGDCVYSDLISFTNVMQMLLLGIGILLYIYIYTHIICICVYI